VRDLREPKVWEKGYLQTLAPYKATTRFPGDEFVWADGTVAAIQHLHPGEHRGRLRRARKRRTGPLSADIFGLCQRDRVSPSLAHDLGLLDEPEHERLTGGVIEAKRMLTSFVRSLRVLANQQNPKADA
jgi:hypothetical protein